MTEQKSKILTWQIRKGLQVVVGIAGIVLTIFGVVTTDQVDAVTASPLLATFGGFLAALFTHRGSDSTATGDDVRAAQQAAQYAPQQVDPEQIAQQAAGRIADLLDGSFGTHLAGAQKQIEQGITSVADYYRGSDPWTR